MGIGSQEVFKAGSALAGGAARMGETCGALTGASLAIGFVAGREKFKDREQYVKAHQVAGREYKQFREKIGHTLCAEIHKIRYGKVCRLFIPEESKAFHDMGGHTRTGYPEVCGVAARIATEVILDFKEKGG